MFREDVYEPMCRQIRDTICWSELESRVLVFSVIREFVDIIDGSNNITIFESTVIIVH